jgi:hypothetical protein
MHLRCGGEERVPVEPHLPADDDFLARLCCDSVAIIGQRAIRNLILPDLDNLEAAIVLDLCAGLGPFAVGVDLVSRRRDDEAADADGSIPQSSLRMRAWMSA